MSAWTQLEQLLTCCICLDRYKNPKLLPCQHSFCVDPCLEGLVDYARRQIKCPECRAEHRIPYQGVQAFPNNVTLMRFLELHRDITGEEPEPPPSMMERCNVCGEKAFVVRCNHCEKKTCTECKEAHVDILRREVLRVMNQVKRGLHRLSETLGQTAKNSEKLQLNGTHVKDEIEELVRRYMKDLKEVEKKMLHDVEIYVLNEVQSINKLKEDLEQEVSNIGSNCDMVEKYVTDDSQWTDVELIEYKDIFLKSLEFMRNFDADNSDYTRRIRFQCNTDPDILHKTLVDFGELKMNTPLIQQIQTAQSVTNTALTPSQPTSALMRSQSDHRLASQFQRKSETSRSYLDLNNRFSGGHASDSERDTKDTSAQFGRSNRREESSSYRRYGDRTTGARDFDLDRDVSTTTSSRSRFLRPADESRYGEGDSTTTTTTPTFRSRYARELMMADEMASSHGDTDHIMPSSRTVRFEEPVQQGGHHPRERLLETDDATKGPLSGIVRLLDSTYVQERLHQNEARTKQQVLEKERQAKEALTRPTPTPIPPPRRQTSRQISEDEIEKQKKQNQAAAARETKEESGAPAVVAPPTPTSPPVVVDRPLSRRVATLQREDTRSSIGSGSSSTTATRSGSLSPEPQQQDSEPLYRRSSSQQDDGGSSSQDGSPSSRHRRRRSPSAELESASSGSGRPDSPRQMSRSTRPPMGKSSYEQSTDRRDDLAGQKSRSVSLGSNKSETGSTLKKPEPEPDTRRPSQTSFYSRFANGTPGGYGQRRVSQPEARDDSSNSDSDSEVSSTESDSDTAENEMGGGGGGQAKKKDDFGPSLNSLLERSAQARRNSVDIKPRNSASSTSSSTTSRFAADSGRDRDNNSRDTGDSYASSFRNRRSLTQEDDSRPSSYLNRRKSSGRGADDDDEATTTPYSRYLARSRTSSAVVGSTGSSRSRDVSPEDKDRTRPRLGSLKKNRLTRGRGSHDATGDDSPDDEVFGTSGSNSFRNKYERFADNALARSRSHHAIRSREQSPEEAVPPAGSGSSAWAQYLRNKYGSGRTASISSGGGTKGITRSRSSHSVYSRSGTDNSSDEEADAPSTMRPRSDSRGRVSNSGISSSNYSFPRSMYLQKRRCVNKIGCRGTEPGCFTWPRGVAVGPDNSIVVADSSNHRVQVFDYSGRFSHEFGSYGNGDGEFDCLAGIAVNRIGQYIVSDRYNHRIQLFDPSGRFLRSFGCEGRLDGRFSYPWGVTTDSLGFIYVCDKENHRIQVFQSDGTFVGKFGSIGSRPGYLEHPHYIAVSNTNRVIVTDSNNHRIQIFDVNGRSLSTFGSEGSDEGQFKFPRGVAVDDQGYIIVGDSGNNRIQIFHPDGTFLKTFGGWGPGDGEFKGLEGIAVMSNGTILVCDRENHRIQVF